MEKGESTGGLAPVGTRDVVQPRTLLGNNRNGDVSGHFGVEL